MSDTTTIVLAAISTLGGIVSSWMASRSSKHASTAAGAASYVAKSLRPPSVEGCPGLDGRCVLELGHECEHVPLYGSKVPLSSFGKDGDDQE